MSTRQQRIEIYKETASIALHDFYLNSYDEMVKLRSCNTDNIICYDSFDGRLPFPPSHATNPHPTVKVINNDTLSCAYDYAKEGYNVTILNMASSYLPGGGVLKGSTAQEEDIFRRSNLLNYLYAIHPIGRDFGLNVPKTNIKYPIDGEFDAIWTPEVAVFRDTDKKGYPLLKEPFYVDVVTCAAIKRPKLTADNHLSARDSHIMQHKIETIFRAAVGGLALEGKNVLILGAFGCGAYKNPPADIAELFRETIEKFSALNFFEEIAFAIIDSNCVGEAHNPNGNFAPFEEEMKKIDFKY